MNFETGEIALRPGVVGYALRKREGKLSYNFRAVNFLRIHPIEKGLYPAQWDGEKLIFKVWTPKPISRPEPLKAEPSKQQPEPETRVEILEAVGPTAEVCPVCSKGHLIEGACDECGWDEAEGIECPEGLIRPFEKPEICKGCKAHYKRAYGDFPARCLWNEWVVKGENNGNLPSNNK